MKSNYSIKDHFYKHIDFTEIEIDDILSHFTLVEFDKKEILLKEGNVCNHKFFIIEGLVRSYHLDHKGNEKINKFAIENYQTAESNLKLAERIESKNLIKYIIYYFTSHFYILFIFYRNYRAN